MSSARGIEGKHALTGASSQNASASGADQENLHSFKAAPSRDADRPPLQALPQGRFQPAQRPRPKPPSSLNLTKKLSAPVRKTIRASENAQDRPTEAASSGSSLHCVPPM